MFDISTLLQTVIFTMDSNILKFTILECSLILLGTSLVLGVPQGLNLDVTKICDKDLVSVHLIWSFKHQTISDSCDVMYSEKDNMLERRTVHVVNSNARDLRNLKDNTEYNVQVQCGNVSSSIQTIQTGLCKSEADQSTSPANDPDVVIYKEESVFTASTMDIALGIVFGLVTVCILAVTGYYVYKRYKRQRRLQQFLRTPHTDPLESLQSYMEEDS